ncbi:hypothetical protein U1769_08020 [Sphingomonas sp. ZT3P38]|uniref:hypothetical protein n=1 Tax=Parasphingomonas zepuensis TaxID=3096161 RepID=UPI002FC73417
MIPEKWKWVIAFAALVGGCGSPKNPKSVAYCSEVLGKRNENASLAEACQRFLNRESLKKTNGAARLSGQYYLLRGYDVTNAEIQFRRAISQNDKNAVFDLVSILNNRKDRKSCLEVQRLLSEFRPLNPDEEIHLRQWQRSTIAKCRPSA